VAQLLVGVGDERVLHILERHEDGPFVGSQRLFLAGIRGLDLGADAAEVQQTPGSAFAFGREDLIPAMFGALLERMKISEVVAPNFHYYLKRHTQLDAETHGPLALQLVAALCCKNDHREQEAMNAAERALEARILFWDGVEAAMKNPDVID